MISLVADRAINETLSMFSPTTIRSVFSVSLKASFQGSKRRSGDQSVDPGIDVRLAVLRPFAVGVGIENHQGETAPHTGGRSSPMETTIDCRYLP